MVDAASFGDFLAGLAHGVGKEKDVHQVNVLASADRMAKL